MYWNFHEDRAN